MFGDRLSWVLHHEALCEAAQFQLRAPGLCGVGPSGEACGCGKVCPCEPELSWQKNGVKSCSWENLVSGQFASIRVHQSRVSQHRPALCRAAAAQRCAVHVFYSRPSLRSPSPLLTRGVLKTRVHHGWLPARHGEKNLPQCSAVATEDSHSWHRAPSQEGRFTSRCIFTEDVSPPPWGLFIV